jgi:hypothetical protein
MFFYEVVLIVSQKSTEFIFRNKVTHAGMRLGYYRKGGRIPGKKPVREDTLPTYSMEQGPS